MQEPTSLQELIRGRREELGVSMRAVAAKTGLEPGYLSRVESGQRKPGLVTLQLLAEALQLSLADLSLAAGLPVAELPSLQPYLRTAYGFSPENAADIERYLHQKYGMSSSPRDGEDEIPEMYI